MEQQSNRTEQTEHDYYLMLMIRATLESIGYVAESIQDLLQEILNVADSRQRRNNHLRWRNEIELACSTSFRRHYVDRTMDTRCFQQYHHNRIGPSPQLKPRQTCDDSLTYGSKKRGRAFKIQSSCFRPSSKPPKSSFSMNQTHVTSGAATMLRFAHRISFSIRERLTMTTAHCPSTFRNGPIVALDGAQIRLDVQHDNTTMLRNHDTLSKCSTWAALLSPFAAWTVQHIAVTSKSLKRFITPVIDHRLCSSTCGGDIGLIDVAPLCDSVLNGWIVLEKSSHHEIGLLTSLRHSGTRKQTQPTLASNTLTGWRRATTKVLSFRDQNVAWAIDNMKYENRLFHAYQSVMILQNDLECSVATFVSLKQKQDVIIHNATECSRASRVKSKIPWDESEAIAEDWLEQGGSTDDFLNLFLERRKFYYTCLIQDRLSTIW